MSMQIARKVVTHFHQAKPAASNMSQLSNRENEILRLLAKGCLYKEIGDQLGISLSTVRTHIHSVYMKLHVETRTEAVVKFLGRG
jgi:DNA-binding NarL/FixJ family response regulator